MDTPVSRRPIRNKTLSPGTVGIRYSPPPRRNTTGARPRKPKPKREAAKGTITPKNSRPKKPTPSRSAASRSRKTAKFEIAFGELNPHDDDTSSGYESKENSDSDDLSLTTDYSHLEDEEVDYECTGEQIDEEDLSEDEDVPDLELPSGSDDIPLEPEHLLDAFEVYETCRTHFRLLMLSPFCIEDFVHVLRSHEQSRLLSEIHIAFLKFALRDDEEEQMIMASNDLNPSFSLLVALLEPMTYAEVLRQYVESDAVRFPKNVLTILSESNYPFCSAKERLIVLKFLCSRFYESGIFRRSALELKYKHDDHCRDCTLHRSAVSSPVFKCSSCEAIYHSSCLQQMNGFVPAEVDGWTCLVCELHKQVPGVSISDLTPENTNLRLEQLGEDRHSRVYWLAGRRIIVVDPSDGSVTYYTTLPQLCSLIYAIGDGRYEKRLHKRLTAEFDRINEQMRMTMNLTTTRHKQVFQQKQDMGGDIYLTLDNVFRVSHIYYHRKEGTLDDSGNALASAARNACGIDEHGNLSDTFWIGSYTESEIAELGEQLVKAPRSPNIEELLKRRGSGFRLGLLDNDFRSYENQYVCNDYARSPQIRAKERDRKKYMNARFALDVNFSWTCPKGRDLFGPAFQTCKSLQWTLDEVRKKIPKALFHRLWGEYCEQFRKDLDSADSVDKLKFMLLKMECAIRKPVFSTVWWNSLGHTTLFRYSVEDKDAKKKEDSAKNKSVKNPSKKKVSDEEANIITVKFRNGIRPKHTLWRVKDEEYRVNGKGQLGGWLWQSRTWRRTFVDELPKVPRGITAKSDPSKFEKNSPEYRAYRLEKLIERFMYWRRIGDGFEHLEARYEKRREVCFSPLCRMGVKYTSYYGPNSGYQQCYNPECRMVFRRFTGPTAGIAKLMKPDKLPIVKKKNTEPKKRYGLEDPFPISDPFDYKSRATRKSSILILKQPILRRLARQGGFSTNVFLHGFSRTAKPSPLYWNIPAPRPTFDNCWRYLTYKAKSLHAIALQLRIMFACIRWSDLLQEEGQSKHVIHGVDGQEHRIVLAHREHPPDGYYEQYKVRIYKLKDAHDTDEADMDEHDDSDEYMEGRIRSGRKAKRPKRSRNAQKRQKQTEIVDQWVDGVDLKLWEIEHYWQSYPRRQVVNTTKPGDVTMAGSPALPQVYPSTSGSLASPQVYPSTSGSPALPQMRAIVGGGPVIKKAKVVTPAYSTPKPMTSLVARTATPVTTHTVSLGRNEAGSPNVFRYMKVLSTPNGSRNSKGRVIPLQRSGNGLPMTYTIVRVAKPNETQEASAKQPADSVPK